MCKLDLVDKAIASGHLMHLHVMLVPVEVSLNRVAERVRNGGNDVPRAEDPRKVRTAVGSHRASRSAADRTEFFDSSTARHPFRRIAVYEHGLFLGKPDWRSWAPAPLTV